MNELFQKINDSTERAKSRYNEQLSRFHIGDIVYPLFQRWVPAVWGTVVEVIPQIHKINVNLQGVIRQFEPEDLILTNPELRPGSDYNEERQKIIDNAERKIKASFSSNKDMTDSQFKDYFCNVRFTNEDHENVIPVKVSADSEETAEGLLNGFACDFMEKFPESSDFLIEDIIEINDQTMEDRAVMYEIDPFGGIRNASEARLTATMEATLSSDLSSAKTYMAAYSKIFFKIKPLISGLKSDIGWGSIHSIVDTIRGMGVDVLPEGVNDSNYRADGGSKEWHYTLSFLNSDDERVEMIIYIVASAAGSAEDPWSNYDITVSLKGGKVTSRGKTKIVPQYKLWRDKVKSLSDSEPVVSGSAPKQYIDFIFDVINKISLADSDCQKLDMDSFKENIIDAMYAFKTAYEFGRQQLGSASENQKLEIANVFCNSLSQAIGVNL